MKYNLLLVLFLTVCSYRVNCFGLSEEEKAKKFVDSLNSDNAIWNNQVVNAEWDNELHPTHYLQQKLKILHANISAWQKASWNKLMKYQWKTFKDPLLKRQFLKYSVLGYPALPEEKRDRLEKVVSEMVDVMLQTKHRQRWHKRLTTIDLSRRHSKRIINLHSGVEIVNISAQPEEECNLRRNWKLQHDDLGIKLIPLYKEYVDLSNQMAILNNFTDLSMMWNDDFEMPDFENVILKLNMQIHRPYQQLHAYIRRKLRSRFNTDKRQVITKSGLLPSHVLGSTSSNDWRKIYLITLPFPTAESVDVTAALKSKNFNLEKMVALTENFFLSLNMSRMNQNFWEKSVFKRIPYSHMTCQAAAWDFYNGMDFRIKMCGEVNLSSLKLMHHEMGHIQYFQHYKDQPFIFRDGANSGFHEAIGDTIALSMSNPKHMVRIGLLEPENVKEKMESQINFLYYVALEKLAFLPYAYMLELWRWEIFKGNVEPSDYNCRFWELKQELLGVTPPVDRGINEFDAGVIYHVVDNVPYIRYFVSTILQFQFHKALCIKAGKYDPDHPQLKPLHQCDIYQSAEAGNALSAMLQLGSSLHWQDALEQLTGQREMDPASLLEYFKPLLDWIEQDNRRSGEVPGWDKDGNQNAFCRKHLKEKLKTMTPVDDGCIP